MTPVSFLIYANYFGLGTIHGLFHTIIPTIVILISEEFYAFSAFKR